MYQVQVRKEHGKWTTRYSLETEREAAFWYHGLNTFGPYRKRLLSPEGRIIIRQEW